MRGPGHESESCASGIMFSTLHNHSKSAHFILTMVNLEGSSRTSKESLNALRFSNLTKKYLVDDDQVDAVKLKQLIHSASIVSERLTEANACSANDIKLRLQLDELTSELSKKCDVLNEIGIAKARAESKNKFSASSSQTRASKPAQIISNDGHGGQTDTDAASGERIHTLLQQQKVTHWSRCCYSYQKLYFTNNCLKKNYAFQHISTQEIEEEKRAQAILMTELVDLTGILKNATIQMSSTVTEQNLVSSLINK